MTQTTNPRPVFVNVRDLRPGDVIVNDQGERCYAAFDVEVQPRKNIARVWTAVSDQDAGRPAVLTVSGTVLIAGPVLEEPDNDQDTEDRQVAGERAAAAAEFGIVAPEGRPFTVAGVIGNAAHVIDSYASAPGVVRVILLNEDHARAAAAVLLQSGYLVTRRAQVLTVIPDTDD